MNSDIILYRALRVLLCPVVKIFFPFEIKGLENLNQLQGSYILCSNHLSNLDPVFLAVSHKRTIRFMAKAELFKNPFFAYIFTKLGAFSINRGRGDRGAISFAENILQNEEILGIFIEGTRSKTGEFLRPRSGVSFLAYKSKSMVVPVCITGGGKNNKVRIFKKTRILYGKPVDVLKTPGSAEMNVSTMRRISADIMNKIKDLRYST